MRFIRAVFRFYVLSSVHVAFAALAFTWLTLNSYNLAYNKAVLCTVFYGTIISYNYVKYFDVFWHNFYNTSKLLQAVKLVTLTALILAPIYLVQLKTTSIIVIALLGIINIWYTIPSAIGRLLKIESLRNKVGLKIFIIAFVWAILTVLLPLIEAEVVLSLDALLDIIYRFLWVLILIIPFEIRDVKHDGINLTTLPQKYGIAGTKKIGYILIGLSVLVLFFKSNVATIHFIIALVMSIIAWFAIWFSSERKSFYYTAFWVEAIPIIWLFVVLGTG